MIVEPEFVAGTLALPIGVQLEDPGRRRPRARWGVDEAGRTVAVASSRAREQAIERTRPATLCPTTVDRRSLTPATPTA